MGPFEHFPGLARLSTQRLLPAKVPWVLLICAIGAVLIQLCE